MAPTTPLNANTIPAVEAVFTEPQGTEAKDATHKKSEETEMEEADINGLYGVNYICPIM